MKLAYFVRRPHLLPAHYRLPAISENDETLIAAQDMLKAYKQLTGKQTVDKIAHARMLQKLSDVLRNTTRCTSQEQPVLAQATSSDPKGPVAIRKLHPVHNMRTHSNEPMPTSFITEKPVATSEGNTTNTNSATLATKERYVGSNHFAQLCPTKRRPATTTRVVNDQQIRSERSTATMMNSKS